MGGIEGPQYCFGQKSLVRITQAWFSETNSVESQLQNGIDLY